MLCLLQQVCQDPTAHVRHLESMGSIVITFLASIAEGKIVSGYYAEFLAIAFGFMLPRLSTDLGVAMLHLIIDSPTARGVDLTSLKIGKLRRLVTEFLGRDDIPAADRAYLTTTYLS